MKLGEKGRQRVEDKRTLGSEGNLNVVRRKERIPGNVSGVEGE